MFVLFSLRRFFPIQRNCIRNFCRTFSFLRFYIWISFSLASSGWITVQLSSAQIVCEQKFIIYFSTEKIFLRRIQKNLEYILIKVHRWQFLRCILRRKRSFWKIRNEGIHVENSNDIANSDCLCRCTNSIWTKCLRTIWQIRQHIFAVFHLLVSHSMPSTMRNFPYTTDRSQDKIENGKLQTNAESRRVHYESGKPALWTSRATTWCPTGFSLVFVLMLRAVYAASSAQFSSQENVI